MQSGGKLMSCLPACHGHGHETAKCEAKHYETQPTLCYELHRKCNGVGSQQRSSTQAGIIARVVERNLRDFVPAVV